MAIKTFKPTSAGVRFLAQIQRAGLAGKSRVLKRLSEYLGRTGGRNNRGRMTSRFMGGGHKRLYRVVDFRRNKLNVPGRVASIHYDPYRTARIALINYVDGEKRLVLAADGLKVGDTILSGLDVDIRPGNSMPLHQIPLGTQIHNVELRVGKGGQVARSAGAFAQLMAKEGDYCLVRLPSGELRRVHRDCQATVGQVGNLEHENVSIGKAGRSRWLGRRPHNRGISMNPVDHPHGGGEGRTKGGRHPVTPWGQPTKGFKTRKNKRTSTFIVKRHK